MLVQKLTCCKHICSQDSVIKIKSMPTQDASNVQTSLNGIGNV